MGRFRSVDMPCHAWMHMILLTLIHCSCDCKKYAVFFICSFFSDYSPYFKKEIKKCYGLIMSLRELFYINSCH